MTTPYIPELDGPEIPEAWLDKERRKHKQQVNNIHRVLHIEQKRVDKLSVRFNDRMFNVCRLAGAALSHLNHIPPLVDKANRAILLARQMQTAIDLLKPLSTGIHDTQPVTPVDHSMGDDPWNEFATHDVPQKFGDLEFFHGTPWGGMPYGWDGKGTAHKIYLDPYEDEEPVPRPDDEPTMDELYATPRNYSIMKDMLDYTGKPWHGNYTGKPWHGKSKLMGEILGEDTAKIMKDYLNIADSLPTMDELYDEYTTKDLPPAERMTRAEIAKRRAEALWMHWYPKSLRINMEKEDEIKR